MRALRMGVELAAPGYNVFVCGLSGTSRGGMIQQHDRGAAAPNRARRRTAATSIISRIPTGPACSRLPRGQANDFKKDMQSGIDFLRRRIPQVFEGEPFQRQKGRIVDRYTAPRKRADGRFHAPHRARAVRAGPHAGRRRGPAGNFPRARRPDGADRRHPQDGPRRQARKHPGARRSSASTSSSGRSSPSSIARR